MKDKGLLTIATAFKSIEATNNSLSAPQAKISAERFHSSNVIVKEKSDDNSKLVSYKKWKKEKEEAQKNLQDKVHKYDHELVSFTNWKDKTDDKYEAIKKAAQRILPEVIQEVDECDDEFDEIEEIFPEAVLESESTYEIDENYNIENLSESLRSSVQAKNYTYIEESSDDDTPLRQKIVFKRKKRNVFFDVLVAVFCIVGCFFSLQTFYDSLNQSLDKINETPIGTISFKYKSAQRKLSDRVLWDRVKQNSPIYNGDIIRTAELSEATITFLDGNTINLYEQSLAQVFYSEKGVAIDFSGGEISIDSSSSESGVSLSAGGNVVELEAGSSLIASVQTKIEDGKLLLDSNSTMALQITHGEAALITAGETKELSAESGSAFLIEANTGDIRSPSVSMFSPQPNSKYLRINNDSVPVVFNWSVSQTTSDDFILELSNQKDFSELVEQMIVTDSSTETFYLVDGMWYWRLYSGVPQNGVDGKFRIEESTVPHTIVPAQDDVYSYYTKAPTIRFVWSEDEFATEWFFEVADNSAMENPTFAQLSSQSSIIVSSLEEGTWFWRATPVYPKGVIHSINVDANSTNVSTFKVVQNDVSSTVDLLLPRKDAVIDINDDQYFSWVHSNEAKSYEIQISKNSDMSSPEIKETVENNFAAVASKSSLLHEGQWYWSVNKTNEIGQQSELGEIRTFLALNGTFSHKTLEPVSSAIVTTSEVANLEFVWENNVPYDTYFQVSSDENFQNLVHDIKVDINSIKGLSISAGKWFWRIVSKNEALSLEYATSPKTLFVENDLDAVQLVEPKQDSVIIVAQNSEVNFAWNPVDSAQYYECRIYNKNNLEEPVFENEKVSQTELSLNMYDMPKGEYLYVMRSVLEDTPSSVPRKSVETSVSFSTRTIDPIRLQVSSRGLTVSGVEALMDTPSVQWSSTEPIVSSEFILSRSERGLSSVARRAGELPLNSQIKLRVRNPSRTIELPPLEEGVWYWTIVGTTTGGYDITASYPSRITVGPINNLPAPTAISPIYGNVFDVDYLSKNQYIDFAWEEVAHAELYHFTLYNQDKEIILERTLKSTNFHFENLEILDRGSFYWAVEATRPLRDGIEQRGNIASFYFEIDLPELNIPHDKTTGDLYGL